MTCDYSHHDGAYVLGALTPTDRQQFESHLAGCPACARAVQELAGLPGLLSRVDPALLETPPDPVPLPATLLPRLVAAVRRDQFRRTWRTVVAAAAAVVVAAVGTWGLAGQLGSGDRGADSVTAEPTRGPARGPAVEPTDDPTAPTAPTTATSTDEPTETVETPPPARAMSSVGGAPVRGSLVLEGVPWGTRLTLTCSYPADPHNYSPSGRGIEYAMFVRTRDGRTEQVATWRSLTGKTMNLDAASAAQRSEITRVEVRTADGRPVLRLLA